MTLDVADDNARAIGFYERVGFTRTGRTGELPHQPGVTEFEMELRAQRPASRLWVNTQEPR